MINKRGSSLVELIVSIALISVIMVFLMRLIIDLNNKNTNSTYAKEDALARSEVLRMIENDLSSKRITNVTSTGSSSTSLVIKFTFKDDKTSTITATEANIAYSSSEGENRSWTMEDGTIYVNKANVDFESQEPFYSFVIDIEVHTTNEKNDIDNNNSLDDFLISYIGSTDDYKGTFNCLGYDC